MMILSNNRGKEKKKRSPSRRIVPMPTSLQRFEVERTRSTLLLCSLPVFLIVGPRITTSSITASRGGRGDGPIVGKGLRFSGSSTFRIALFADLHYGENAWDDWGRKQDVKSDRVQANVLDNETPGDTACSFRGTTRIELVKTEILKNSLSHTQSGPTMLWPGISNYILQISSFKDLETPTVFLYFFDSGGGSYPEVISYAQVKWFQEKSQEINPHAGIPELIFWHIPSEAYKTVAPSLMSTIHSPCIGSINDEEVASQVAEWGLMDALLERSSVKAVFVGHNHGLDWCCPYQKLWLCFARHTGYGGYGTWPRGARIIEMTEDPFSLNSWIRMEDGTNHSYVTLSSRSARAA